MIIPIMTYDQVHSQYCINIYLKPALLSCFLPHILLAYIFIQSLFKSTHECPLTYVSPRSTLSCQCSHAHPYFQCEMTPYIHHATVHFTRLASSIHSWRSFFQVSSERATIYLWCQHQVLANGMPGCSVECASLSLPPLFINKPWLVATRAASGYLLA